ncbi:beta-galactosidase-1-like protein 3 isoform X3 [Homalodisca vitripennis]|nr:beta-galactosidase-1-like protein 3 isoform X3 [Homalodisca vitripennis]
MASLQGRKTVYQHYRIVEGQNEGLTASEPQVFRLNGQNLTITSGTIHYFRVHPHYWRDRLRKLRAMGAVAVETYAPWNLHEPYKDKYDFGNGGFEMSPFLDVVKFLKMALKRKTC